jgi:pyridoxal phosphate enzyme (YggS family)
MNTQMTIATKIKALRNSLPSHVELVAVSKTKPVEDIMEAYQSGQRLFGENKAQELALKAPLLPSDIRWHFIGHLQTNKVRMVVPLVSVIHSVDSLKLLQAIDREARLAGKLLPCLLEFRIAGEETKYGLTPEEGTALLASEAFRQMSHITIAGVMGMASFTNDVDRVRAEFRKLRLIFEQLKARFFPGDPHFREISMGMSGDYRLAIEEGSTMVRIGTTIFSERNALDK